MTDIAEREFAELTTRNEPIDENTNLNELVEESAAVIVPVLSKAKTKKTKINKVRNINELKDASIKGMSEKELRILATSLKEDLALAQEQAHAYSCNCDIAYGQLCQMRKEVTEMKQAYEQRLQFIVRTIRLATESINMSLKA